MQEIDPGWSVFGTFASSVVQAGEQLDAPVESLLEATGIEQQLLKHSEGRLPVAKVMNLIDLIAGHTHRPDIGVIIGRIVYINSLNLQLYMSTICKTFRDYLNLMPSLLRLCGDIGEVTMEVEGSYLKLNWRPLWKSSERQTFLSDIVLADSAFIVNSLCLLPVPVRKACFSYPEPVDKALLHETFGDNLSFDQPVSCLYFDRSSLDYPLTALNADLSSTFTLPLNQWFDQEHAQDEFLGELRKTLAILLPQGIASIDKLAEAKNLSRRTLQRRLADRDTQFSQLLQQVRSDLAKRYLADERLSVTEIAFLLGYSDQSSFSSAFKTWFGESPAEYRRS